jgi:hypothetical protein
MNRHGLESQVVLRKTVRTTNNFYVDKGFCLTELPALNTCPSNLPKYQSAVFGEAIFSVYSIYNTKLIAQ